MEFSVAGYYYAFPADDDLVMAVARADRGTLHLEARYNYEDRRTASVFAGWNFAAGETFTIELTPMAGIAFGNTRGIIPALEMSLGYGPLDLYAEGEYLFDLRDKEGNFAYTWLELGFTPADPLRAGLVAQRTRIFREPVGSGPGTVRPVDARTSDGLGVRLQSVHRELVPDDRIRDLAVAQVARTHTIHEQTEVDHG